MGDVEYNKINELMKLSLSMCTHGEKGYSNYWGNNFSVENHIDELEKVYKKMLERG